MKKVISVGESIGLAARQDALLLLTKPGHRLGDVEVISFSTRAALEAFNKRANLNAVVKTQVPAGCVLYRHESDSDARNQIECSFERDKKILDNRFMAGEIEQSEYVRQRIALTYAKST